MKNRLGIFLFYNKENKVADYVIDLLHIINKSVNSMAIVINGQPDKAVFARFEFISNNIFVRDNIGFDVGGYKDYFEHLFLCNGLEGFDEIIFFNDSFYGLCDSFEYIFEQMDSEQIDFWGISKNSGSQDLKFGHYEIPEHVQSYFICVKKRMFMSEFFREYWINMEYPSTFLDAIGKFELTFTRFFSQRGFIYSSYTDFLYEKYGVPCYDIEDLIIKYDYPILKRKYVGVHHYISCKRILEHIRENHGSLFDSIRNDIKDRVDKNEMLPYNLGIVNDFVNRWSKLYIFGNGTVGKNIVEFLKEQEINISGIITSNGDQETIRLNSFELCDNGGIIVGVGYKNFLQLYDVLVRQFGRERILFPEFENDLMPE